MLLLLELLKGRKRVEEQAIQFYSFLIHPYPLQNYQKFRIYDYYQQITTQSLTIIAIVIYWQQNFYKFDYGDQSLVMQWLQHYYLLIGYVSCYCHFPKYNLQQIHYISLLILYYDKIGITHYFNLHYLMFVVLYSYLHDRDLKC